MMKLLAIKGGGIRGTLTAKLGERLEKRVPGWDSRVTCFAGTSTGAIIAVARAASIPWREIRVLYQEHAASIFARPEVAGVGAAPAARAALGMAIQGALYSNEPLRDVLEEAFGNRTLRELKRDVLVPAISLDVSKAGQRPRLHWFTRQREGGLKIVDVLLAACAAPVYLPSHMGCVDAGVVMNDPSVAALLEACGGWTRLGGEFLLGRIQVFTLGSGRVPRPEGHLGLLAEGGLLGVVNGALKMLGENHKVLDPKIDGEIELDGGGEPEEAVQELLEIGREAKILKSVDWLEEHGWGA